MKRKEFLKKTGQGLLSLPFLPSLWAPSRSETCDVVIVGAGLSGLTAARLLARSGKTVRVLEAQERVGGRTWSQPIGDNAFIDIGGQWIGKGHERMYTLTAEAGIATFPTYVTGKSLWRYQGQQKAYRGDTPPLGLLDLLAVQKALNRLERLATSLPLHQPGAAADLQAMDTQSLGDWVNQTINRPVARQVVNRLAEGELCLPTGQVSLLQTLNSAKSTGSLRQVEQVEGGALQDRLMGGTQAISQFLYREVADSVRLNTPVTFVEYGPEGVRLGNDRYTVRARKLICTAPLPVLKAIRFSPALPVARQMLIDHMVMGKVIKCHAVYDSPFWRDQGLNGNSTTLDETVELSVDNSVPGSAQGILATLIHADRATYLLSLSHEARRQVVLDGFTRLFGQKAGHPLLYHDYSYTNNPWIGGAYSGYFKPGIFATYGAHLTTPCGPIHWAGTETAHVFRGFMEGAVQSGERAAQEVLRGSGLK